MGQLIRLTKDISVTSHVPNEPPLKNESFICRDKDGKFLSMYTRSYGEWARIYFTEEEKEMLDV